ncbi:MAG: glycosyltransferase [Bacteroidota bacterium]
MKIAVISSRFPYPLEKGDKLRLYHQIKYLARRHEVVLISLADEMVKRNALAHIKNFCTSVYLFPLQKNVARFNAVKFWLQQKPLEVGYFFNKNFKKQIDRILTQEKPDHIFCQLIRVSEYVRHSEVPKTLDFMDAFSVGMARRAENSNLLFNFFLKKDARQLADYERVIFSDFDAHTIISKQDRALLNFDAKQTIRVLPNGIDTDFFSPKHDFVKTHDLAFVGNMGYYPNVQAAIFLVKKILPDLQRQYPNLKVLIAGARPTVEVKKLASNNVTISGWLEDIREGYAAAKIFVAPIFHGRGQQNKILEAMAMGIPCITSDQVNQAIGAVPKASILIANSVESCQEQISLLLTDPTLRQKLSTQGLDFVRKNYSWEKHGKQLEEILCL